MKSKSFVPFILDVWPTRYTSKAQADQSGNVGTIVIKENISENQICDILDAVAIAEYGDTYTDKKSPFAYAIREVPKNKYLVIFRTGTLPGQSNYAKRIVINASDLEEATNKANSIRTFADDYNDSINIMEAMQNATIVVSIKELDEAELKFAVEMNLLDYVEKD